MIHSMTAFARHSLEKDFGVLTWEIYSVNHRYLDVTFKLPESLRVLEPQLRLRLSQHLHRGKVECQLKYKPTDALNHSLLINQNLLQAFAQAAQDMRAAFNQEPSISLTELLTWPHMLQNPAADSTLLQQDTLLLLDETLIDLVDMRQREGQGLKTHLQTNLQQLATEIDHIKKQLPLLLKQYREKMLMRIEALQISIDPARLEQELLFITQKSDVCEEIERLQMHIIEVKKTLAIPGAVGRRLDFLMQELHREANTLGAKSLDSQVTHAVVNLKVWIEQMREQVQNIE